MVNDRLRHGTYLGAEGAESCTDYGQLNLTITVQRCSWASWGLCLTWDNVYSWWPASGSYVNTYNSGWLWYTPTKGDLYRIGVDGYFNHNYMTTTYTNSTQY